MKTFTCENKLLKEAIEREQNERLQQSRDMSELIEKLKLTEVQMHTSEDIRYKLSIDIQTLQLSIQRLTKKLNANSLICEMCTDFLQKNGVLATSFLSESANP